MTPPSAATSASPAMRLDHLVLATPDPATTLHELTSATGVPPAEGGPHVGMGTRNWLAALATDDPADRVYLEVIGPDPDQPEPEAPRPFGVDDLTATSLVWWCARSENLVDTLSSLSSLSSVAYGDPLEMRRRSPAGELRWLLSFPSDLGGTIPFVIDWLDSPHPSGTAPSGLRLDRFEIGDPHPDELDRRLRALGAFPAVVARAPVVALRATLSGPDGAIELHTATRA